MRPLLWDNYLLVDADEYREAPERMLAARGHSVVDWALSLCLLSRLCEHAPREREYLMHSFDLQLYEDPGDMGQRLELLLGPYPRKGMLEPPGKFARLLFLQPDPPPRTPLPVHEPYGGWKPAPLSATDAWVVVQCIDERDPQRPISGIRVQVITASAEVRTASTDTEGIARVDGIAPGRVTIRLLDLDGSLWRPVEGDAAKPSPDDERFVWHEVKQGECLSKLARRYGRKYWQDVWKFRLNKDLRAKRRSPHVLYPGDMLAVPAPQLHEIVRTAEETYTLAIDTRSKGTLRLKLLEEDASALSGRYELYWGGKDTPQLSGSLDSDGVLKAEVPLHLTELEVRLPERGLCFAMRPSWLDPLESEDQMTLSGVAERLRALGYLQRSNAPSESELTCALAAFQRKAMGRDAADGAWDAETHAQLEQAHGG